jgi:hypothetical protein
MGSAVAMRASETQCADALIAIRVLKSLNGSWLYDHKITGFGGVVGRSSGWILLA